MFPYNIVSAACDIMGLSRAEGDVFLRVIKDVADYNDSRGSAHDIVAESMIRWYNNGILDMSNSDEAVKNFRLYLSTKDAIDADDKTIDANQIADFIKSTA
jgi:hypothetical protein